MNIDELSPLIDDLASHVQNVMGIKSMPAITLQEDADNADVLLGRTAQYDPQNKVVTVYVTNRHPKDIMRSISHELIHHSQNERGEFDNVGAVGEGYAQADKHLRNMEKEAYLKGNMCFRDWEDGYKRQMMESIHRQNSFKRRNNTMKIHKWKNNELNRLLMEKFNFGENTLLNEAHCAGNNDEDEDREKMEEAHCMGQGSRGDEECPECGKKNCPGKDGKKVNEEQMEEGEIPQGLKDYQEKQKAKKGDDKEDDEKEDKPKSKSGKLKMTKDKDDKDKDGDKDDEVPAFLYKEVDESFRVEIRKQLEEILKIK